MCCSHAGLWFGKCNMLIQLKISQAHVMHEYLGLLVTWYHKSIYLLYQCISIWFFRITNSFLRRVHIFYHFFAAFLLIISPTLEWQIDESGVFSEYVPMSLLRTLQPDMKMSSYQLVKRQTKEIGGTVQY